MLIKPKTFTPSADHRRQAGDEAEKQMAYLLDRRFEARDDVFLLHDLRIENGRHAFQIDHLVVTRYGLFLVESKSIHSTVSITRHDERREHWSRTFRGREEGIPSPVRQVQEQGRLLHEFLRENREQILGKLLGLMQKGYKNCPVDTLVGVSTSATFKLVGKTPLPEHVFKADEVAPEIELHLADRKKRDTLFNLKAELPWAMSRDEALATARFLLRQHTPLHKPAPEAPASAPSAPAAPACKASRPCPYPQPDTAPTALPQPGAPCPACGKHVLAIAAGPARADGSRERFLACLGNRDGSCTWKQPLDAAGTAPATEAATHADVQPEDRTAKRYYCYACKVPITKEVGKFCWDRKSRFRGKAYCVACQSNFPEPAKDLAASPASTVTPSRPQTPPPATPATP